MYIYSIFFSLLESQVQDLSKYMDVSWNLKPTAHITGSKVETADGTYKKKCIIINMIFKQIKNLR